MRFSNESAINNFLRNKLQLNLRENTVLFISEILCLLNQEGSLKLRNIIKYKNDTQMSSFVLDEYDFSKLLLNNQPIWVDPETTILQTDSKSVELLDVIVLLSKMYGSITTFIEELKRISDSIGELKLTNTRSLEPVAMSHHFLSTRKAPLGFYFNYTTQPYTNNTRYIIRSEQREFSLGGINYSIHTAWNSARKYKQGLSYFAEFNFYTTSESSSVLWSSVLNNITQFVSWLERNEKLHKIGVFSK